MYIDKFKKEDGYYDPDGCFYEDAETFIATYMFGFCGCGMPDEALRHVRDSLQIIMDMKEQLWTKKITYNEWEERKKKCFSNSGSEYFMWYVLDKLGFTEHGSSVPGWLTQGGMELLSDLNELYKITDNNETL